MTWNDDVIDTARAFADRVRAAGSTAWYRGHRYSSWELKSAAHRHIQRLKSGFTKPLSEEATRSLLREECKTVYRRFKADAWSLLDSRERSDWGVLFTMQHFGLPTRLLDWTESFACAVFFAQLRRERNETAAVWMLDSEAVNALSIGNSGLLALDEDTTSPVAVDPRAWHPKWKPPADPLPTVAVAPIFTNTRMVAQRSVFTLMGDSMAPLDEQFGGRLLADGHLARIDLPPKIFDNAEEYLSMAGVTAFNYYPDLEGLRLKHEARVEQTIRDAKKFYPELIE